MATKTLIRTGASVLNRLRSKPPLHSNPNSINHIASPTLQIITPKQFPSVSFPPPQNDAESIIRVFNEGFLHPCGLPHLIFPEGDEPTSNEPMILFPKRTFQPSTLRRKRNHGFFARKATKGGRRVIARRIVKGRARITA